MKKSILFASVLVAGLQFSAAWASCETNLSISANLADGEIIKLDDGSVWKLDDTFDSQLWMAGDDVAACDDKLVHLDDGEEADAERLK